MRLTQILLSLTSLTCLPLVSAWGCLSDDDANDIVSRQTTFLAHQNLTAARDAVQTLFSPNLLELSDSINTLRGVKLGTPVYTNSTAYLADTLSTPPIAQVNKIDMFHDCRKILFYWEFIGIGGPMSKGRCRGMSIINVDDQGTVLGHQIEFNSLQWAANLGYNISAPPGFGNGTTG